MIRVLLLSLALIAALAHGADRTITATGSGANLEAAKQAAFRQAIELEIGVLVLGDRETVNLALIKDEIYAYSAGYVDSYRVISTAVVGAKTQVIVEVHVSPIKLTNRILSVGRSANEINGQSLTAQYSTYVNQKQQGDRILDKLLDQYPQRAYQVTQGVPKFQMDSNRAAVLSIPVMVKWNSNYLDSLHETLALIQDGTNNNTISAALITMTSPKLTMKTLLNKPYEFHFNDRRGSAAVKSALNDRAMMLKLSLKSSGQALYSQCYETQGNFFQWDDYQIDIFGRAVENTQINLTIPPGSSLSRILAESTEVSVTVDSAANCSN